MKRRLPTSRILEAAIGVALVLAGETPATAWHASGHHQVGEAATRALPRQVPAFFRQGAETVGHLAEDPDLWKEGRWKGRRGNAAPQLAHTEFPEHFLDSELLGGRGLPQQRWDFVAQLARLDLDPHDVGMLPYAIVEGTQKLTLAFAEHRKWPGCAAIQQKTLVHAGRLAHYAGDLAQPLHTSVHYDGRRHLDRQSGTYEPSPHTGIHFLVDALFDSVDFDRKAALRDWRPRPLAGEMLPAVMDRFQRSHRELDRSYGLERDMREAREGAAASPELRRFTAERFRDAVDFLAALYLRAWEDSAQVEFPDWHRRSDC